MLKKIATIFSVLLHPMLMPTIGLLVLFSTRSHVTMIPYEYRRLITIIVLVSTCILPLSLIPIFIQTKIIKSIHMETARERTIPLLATGMFYILGYFFLKKFQLPSFIPLYILGTLVTVILSMCISFFWKISIHMIGIGGVLGALLGITLKYGVNTSYLLLIVIFVAGLLGSCRLQLNAHTPLQIYSGFLLGTTVICAVVLL